MSAEYTKIKKSSDGTLDEFSQVELPPESATKKMSCGCKFVLVVMVMLTVIGASCVTVNAFFFPLHASCKITYKFNSDDCTSVKKSIIEQIDAWSGTECGEETSVHQKCRYALVQEKQSKIIATHTTPLKKYIDDMTLDFESTSTTPSKCTVEAYSTSRLWYAVLDYGTNYCNSHNLIAGTSLTDYTESTSDSICTQYSSADCTRY